MDQARARRLAKRISQIVASSLEHSIKDPRLALVTITDTKITGDLRDATVYYTVRGASLAEEPDFAGAAAALEKAKGVLRTTVGQQTGVRFTPTLTFVADAIPAHAEHMTALLNQAKVADEQVAKLAEGALPAGEADPYKAPRTAEDEQD